MNDVLCCYILKSQVLIKKRGEKSVLLHGLENTLFFLYSRRGCQCNFTKWDDILTYQARCWLACLWQLFFSLFLATKEHNVIRLSEVGSTQQELISLCSTETDFLGIFVPLKSTYTHEDTYKPWGIDEAVLAHFKIKTLGMTRRKLLQNGSTFLSLFRFLCIFSLSHRAFFLPDIFVSFLPSTFPCNSDVKAIQEITFFCIII